MSSNRKTVFISYCTEERETADLVKESLENNGFSCWMAPESIPPGSNYAIEIPKGITEAMVFVLILSGSSMNSGWVTKEVDCAISHKKIIIPFRIDEADINPAFEFYLNNVQRIEAYRRIKMALGDLVDSISKIVNTSNQRISKIYLDTIIRHPSCVLVGRDEELATIAEKLNEERVVTISGLGGIGKSEITKEFAKRNYNKKYKIIQFVDYTESLMHTVAKLSFCNFNEKQFLETFQETNEDESSVVEATYQRKRMLLEECRDDVLVIIDGMDNLNDPFINSLFNLSCHVLISTRCYFEQFPRVNIDPLKDPAVLKKLFLSYYRDCDEEDQEAIKYIEKILELVSGHTMTIKLIAQYLQTSGYEPKYIYEVLRKKSSLKALSEDKIKHGDQYLSVNLHLNSLFNVVNFSDLEKLIMANLSLIPSFGIKKYQFRNYINNDEAMSVVQQLIDTGWILSGSGKISLHPLVADIVHQQIKPNTVLCQEFVNNMMENAVIDKLESNARIEEVKNILLYMAEFLSGEDETMIRFLAIAGHYESTYAYRNLFAFQDLKKVIKDIRQAVDEKGLKYQDFKHAFELVNQSLQIAKKIKLANNDLYGEIYFHLASISFNLKNYEDAIEYNKTALQYHSNEYCQKVFTIYRRLSINYQFVKDYDKSLEYIEKALKIIDNIEILEENLNFEKSRLVMNLAQISLSKNELSKALEYYQQAIDLIKDDDNYDISCADLLIELTKILEKTSVPKEQIRANYQKALESYELHTVDEETIHFLKTKISEYQ